MSSDSTDLLPVRVDGLEKGFGRRRLWSGVSFQIGAGQMLSLAGASGSGKTTLLNCVGLLEPSDKGAIRFGNVDGTRPGRGLRRRLYQDTIGFLFQNSGLVESWTVRENVQIALGHRRMGSALKRAAIQGVLDRMGVGGFQDDPVHTLSGGEQQRVGLARLLLKKPRVVLADEPTASLDVENAMSVIEALQQLALDGAAVMVSTHDERVLGASDGILRLHQGSRERGALAEVSWLG